MNNEPSEISEMKHDIARLRHELKFLRLLILTAAIFVPIFTLTNPVYSDTSQKEIKLVSPDGKFTKIVAGEILVGDKPGNLKALTRITPSSTIMGTGDRHAAVAAEGIMVSVSGGAGDTFITHEGVRVTRAEQFVNMTHRGLVVAEGKNQDNAEIVVALSRSGLNVGREIAIHKVNGEPTILITRGGKAGLVMGFDGRNPRLLIQDRLGRPLFQAP